MNSETEEEVAEESSSNESNSEPPEQFQQLNLQNSLHLLQKRKTNLICFGNQRTHMFQPPQCDVPYISSKLKVNIG